VGVETQRGQERSHRSRLPLYLAYRRHWNTLSVTPHSSPAPICHPASPRS
jgi:hypothetical protein